MKIRSFVASLFFVMMLPGYKSFCQAVSYDSALVQQLIASIYYLQQHHEKDFPMGLIPSYREYDHNRGIVKNDDNIFFTGLVVFTLRTLYNYLDKTSQRISDSIISLTTPMYPAYQNRKGRQTYNFWRTDKPEIFPNGGWLNLFNKSQALPDDLDDTAIVLMAMNSDSSKGAEVHRLMQAYTNNSRKKAKSSLPVYKNIAAYSTWFGKKMPVDLDFCVLTNILFLVHKYQLPYTAADSASLVLIDKVVENRHYMNAAPLVSPHYNKTPLLLYHLSRLMAEAGIPVLEKWKPQLIRDATSSYKQSKNFMEKIVLSTALLRWGVALPDDTLFIDSDLKTITEKSEFVFFIANITSILPRPLNIWLGKTGIGKFSYYCPAWNYTLLVENMIWRKRMEKGLR